MLHLTLGAIAPDGGSVLLEGMLDGSRPIRIYLDFSHYAQASNLTTLDVDGRTLAKGSQDEAEWLAMIAAADTAAHASLPVIRDNLLDKVRSPIYTGSRASS